MGSTIGQNIFRSILCLFAIGFSFADCQLQLEVPRDKQSPSSTYTAPLLSPGVVFLVVIISLLGAVMVYNIVITIRVMCQYS